MSSFLQFVHFCFQVARLLQELKKAKEAEGPGAKLLSNLEKKILQVELRHQLREEELQQVPRIGKYCLLWCWVQLQSPYGL